MWQNRPMQGVLTMTEGGAMEREEAEDARRRTVPTVAFADDTSAAPAASAPMTDEHRRTVRGIRAALAFGLIAATLEIGVLLYFFR
jgi:hypothetical protein